MVETLSVLRYADGVGDAWNLHRECSVWLDELLCVLLRPTLSFEARLDALLKDIDCAHERISQAQSDMDQIDRDHSKAMQQEQREREKEIQELRGVLETTETGGLSLSAVGAVWLFLGVAMSTAAPELARLASYQLGGSPLSPRI